MKLNLNKKEVSDLFILSNLRSNRIYSNTKFIYSNGLNNDKRKGNLVLLNTMGTDQSIELLNSNLVANQFTGSYYIEPVIHFKVLNVSKVIRTVQQQEYSIIKGRARSIIRTHTHVKDYNGLSLYYDINDYNDVFFKQIKNSGAIKGKEYVNMLHGRLNDPMFNDYPNKYVLIPFNEKIDVEDSTNIDSPAKVLLNIHRHTTDAVSKLSGVTFVFMSTKTNTFIKFDGSDLNSSGIILIKRLLKVMDKLNSNQSLSDEEKALYGGIDVNSTTQSLPKDKTEVVMNAVKSVMGVNGIKALTGDEVRISDKMEEIAASTAPNVETTTELADELSQNAEFVRYMNDLKEEKLTAKKANVSNKRNELLRKEHKEVKVDDSGKTLDSIVQAYNDRKLELRDLNVDTRNKELNHSSIADFETNYNKKQNLKDQVMIINSFSDEKREIPMYVRKIEREDSSDEFSKKETLRIQFEDEKRVRHSVTVDLPKFIDDKYLYLNGSKKSLSKQMILVPIAKTGPDTVQANSNYGKKVFLTRYGQKISPKIERLKKVLATIDSPKVEIKPGDSSLVNIKYLNTLEYDELASSIMLIKLPDITLIFNHTMINEIIASSTNPIKIKDDQVPIGIRKDGTLVILDSVKNQVIGTNSELTDFIIDEIGKEVTDIESKLEAMPVGKKYVYTRASILNQKVPLIMILSFNEGLTTILNKAKIKHEFSDKRRRLDGTEKNKTGMVQFKDTFLYYDMYPYRNSLLMNALNELPTKDHNYEEFNSRELYIELFYSMFGTRNIAKGFDNFIELFLDPITLEILEDLDLPTNFTDLMLYGNALLEDNTYTRENDMAIHRIRSNELVNAILYQKLAESYAVYKNTSSSGNPIKVSLPRDAVIKELVAQPLVEDYSVLSPVRELEMTGNASYKGPSGKSYLPLNFMDCWK